MIIMAKRVVNPDPIARNAAESASFERMAGAAAKGFKGEFLSHAAACAYRAEMPAKSRELYWRASADWEERAVQLMSEGNHYESSLAYSSAGESAARALDRSRAERMYGKAAKGFLMSIADVQLHCNRAACYLAAVDNFLASRNNEQALVHFLYAKEELIASAEEGENTAYRRLLELRVKNHGLTKEALREAARRERYR
jgi:hypothetical protein